MLSSFCLCSGCHTPEMRLTRGVGRCEGFCGWEEHVKGQSTRVQCCGEGHPQGLKKTSVPSQGLGEKDEPDDLNPIWD